MQNHQFDLQVGESVCFSDYPGYRVTLLKIENDAAVLEIEGPDGEIRLQPISSSDVPMEEEFAALV
ncbi:MAG: hypothetical protein R3C59_28460 [Planctomycetaceae bacterium]